MYAKSRDIGSAGEDIAARYLESNGFEILERNFRWRAGEIDIVARDGAVLVFVEVKTRRPGPFGSAAEQITARKRRRIVRTALAYMAGRGMAGVECRFDVVAVDLLPSGTPLAHLIKGAFDCGG
ncbi:MAG: YraN family protein [Bacillota bacterium]|nr:YraN family protein [Bacillota bacterium]